MKIIIDTSAFVASSDADDREHERAMEFFKNLPRGDRLFTSNFILDETVTRLRYTSGHAAAVGFAQGLLTSRSITMLRVDAEAEFAALEVMKRFKDKKLSFTDCTTMALARSRGFDAILSFDDDFRKAGFRTVPG